MGRGQQVASVHLGHSEADISPHPTDSGCAQSSEVRLWNLVVFPLSLEMLLFFRVSLTRGEAVGMLKQAQDPGTKGPDLRSDSLPVSFNNETPTLSLVFHRCQWELEIQEP